MTGKWFRSVACYIPIIQETTQLSKNGWLFIPCYSGEILAQWLKYVLISRLSGPKKKKLPSASLQAGL